MCVKNNPGGNQLVSNGLIGEKDPQYSFAFNGEWTGDTSGGPPDRHTQMNNPQFTMVLHETTSISMVLLSPKAGYSERAFVNIHLYQKTSPDIWETSFTDLICATSFIAAGDVQLHSNQAVTNGKTYKTSLLNEGTYVVVISHDKPGRKWVPYQFAVVGNKEYQFTMDTFHDNLQLVEYFHFSSKVKNKF